MRRWAAILASSSGQPPSALYEQVTRRERVIATHFWYPPQLIPLVEVCGGALCDPAVLARSCAVIRGAGKEPVVIDREIPGFIGNRIQFAMLREAWSLWASGAASAEAIDAVVRNSIGRRLAVTGPLESADIGGLGTMVAFARSLLPDLDCSLGTAGGAGRPGHGRRARPHGGTAGRAACGPDGGAVPLAAGGSPSAAIRVSYAFGGCLRRSICMLARNGTRGWAPIATMAGTSSAMSAARWPGGRRKLSA